MKNFEELKEAIKSSSFNESHLSKTQVVDLETVIGLIEDFEQCNIANVVGRIEQFFAFTDDYFKRDKEIAEALRPEFEYWLKNKGK